MEWQLTAQTKEDETESGSTKSYWLIIITIIEGNVIVSQIKISVYLKICVQRNIDPVCANNKPEWWAELKSIELHCEYDTSFSLYFFLFGIKEKSKAINYVIFQDYKELGAFAITHGMFLVACGVHSFQIWRTDVNIYM